MKCARIFSVAVTLAATSMFGQSFTRPPHIDPSKCPVGLEVEQNGSLVPYKNPRFGPDNESDPAADGVHQRSQQFDFKMTNYLRPSPIRPGPNVAVFGRGFVRLSPGFVTLR